MSDAEHNASESTEEKSGDTPDQEAPVSDPLPPTVLQYAGIVAAGWIFITIALALLNMTLPSARGLILLGILLGSGLLVVCIFDYVYLRMTHRS